MRPFPAIYTIVWLIALAGFVTMAAFAAAHDTFPADAWLTHRLQDVHSSAFANLLDGTEYLARIWVIAPLTVLAAVAFYYIAGSGPAVLALATLAARPLNTAVKEIVERPRPSAALVRVEDQPADYSFPSGHANNALLFYGLIFYLAAFCLPDRRLRLPVQALCLWAVTGNALQRVNVGAHWPSDVAGGLYLGGLALAALIAAHRLYLTCREPGTGSAAVRS